MKTFTYYEAPWEQLACATAKAYTELLADDPEWLYHMDRLEKRLDGGARLVEILHGHLESELPDDVLADETVWDIANAYALSGRTLDKFKAGRRAVPDLRAVSPDFPGAPDPVPGLSYGGGVYIEFGGGNGHPYFYLQIENQEYGSDDLSHLEAVLYVWALGSGVDF